MGKKLKLVESVPPDVFEKLPLEPQQAATAVLMLDSPEDDIVIKACDAIFRYSEKCEENKVILLSIPLIMEKLLQLLVNDEALVRRSACMAFASLSQHTDTRKYLRKLPQTIRNVVHLMAHDDNAVVQEYGALCLSFLAFDFTAKISIVSTGGLIQLVRCLCCDDPDIIKNSLEAITLTLQDYEAKASFCNIPDAISSVMEMLGSQYPVIQYQALLALTALAQDGFCRSMLCELGIVSYIVDFQLKPERPDLQVYAIILLENCLEDQQILKLYKEAGGLQVLTELITDKTSSPSDEVKGQDKDDKGKKGKGGKADGGRKSRIVDADESRAKNKNATDPDITALPDLKEHVCRAISRCARLSDYRKLLHELDVEKKLVGILTQDKNVSTQLSAAFTLGVMAEFEPSRETIGKLDAIDAMNKLVLKRDNGDALEAVSFAFANLTVNNENNRSEIMKCGALELIVALVVESRELTASSAATALANMAPQEAIRSEMRRLRAVSGLVKGATKTRSTLVQSRCLWALSSLVSDMEARSQFVEASGLEALIQLLTSRDLVVVKSASWLLALLASSDPTLASNLCKLGGIDVLRQIQNSSTRQNALSQLALSKLYNLHLTAKYAFTGSLDDGDIITDGFYDVGQLKAKDHLKAVEEYGREALNDLRPVIIINPQPETTSSASTLVADSDGSMDRTSNISTTGRSSRSGRDTKTKRSQKEKDAEKQREEEQLLQQSLQREAERMAAEAAARESREYTLPADPQLLSYIAHVNEHIKTLPSSAEQASALARFVSDKMGGPLSSCQPSNLWENEMKKLKESVNSNVVPIGRITHGFYFHRALLYKVLADRIGLQTSLVRSDYGRAWNRIVLLLTDVTKPTVAPLLPTSYIIDVMHCPGEFIDSCSYDALAYMTSQAWQT